MNYSGKDWWNSNQSKYPNSNDVEDLHPSFRDNAKKFIAILRDCGASVKVASTLRNKTRVYLMHYSWKVANEEIEPSEVPKEKGVDIIWDHGDKAKSINGAREMAELFNLAYRPSLTSNHIKGLAIDMNISWKGDLVLGPLPDGRFEGIDGTRSGARNQRLHEIGREYGVIKLLSDPPHWSVNGR